MAKGGKESGPASMPRSSKRAAVDVEVVLPTIRRAVDERGALSTAELKALGVPTKQCGEVVGRLVREGYEKQGSGVRVPLARQVGALLEARQIIAADPSKTRAMVSKGASAPDIKRALQGLVSRGEAKVVLRGKKQVFLVERGVRSIAGAELKGLMKQAAAVVELCKLALAEKPLAAGLLWSDVDEQVEGLKRLVGVRDEPRVGGARGEGKGGGGSTTGQRGDDAGDERVDGEVLEALRGAVRASVGLAFVADAVRGLEARVSRARIHERLIALDRGKKIELRPEAGVGRFTAEELERCPPGPRGFFLVWARLTEGT